MKTTFTDLNEQDFETYALAVLSRFSESEKRKDATSYIKHVLSTDSRQIEKERDALRIKIRGQRRRARISEKLITDIQFDFARTPDLFINQELTPAEINSRLGSNGTETYLRSDLAVPVVISGDNCLLSGSGNRLSAKDGLVNTISINQDISVSGDNAVIRDLNINTQGTNTFTPPATV